MPERTWTPGAKTIRALQIIRDRQPDNARAFGRLMWPDSEGWRRHQNVGTGAAVGVGMWKAAGSYLGRLKARGLVRGYGGYRSTYHLTEAGEQALEDWEREHLL